MNNVADLQATEWGYTVFQRCVPEQYRTSIPVLVGKYSDSHPSDKSISRIVELYDEWKNAKNENKPKDIVKFIKENF